MVPMPGKHHATFVWIFCLAMLSCTIGCTNVITPPRNLTNPQNVYLLDYGRHSSLLLPSGTVDGNPHFTEYAYGEWDWYANKKNDSLRTIPTLLWPTAGTLGRNTWTLTDTSPPAPDITAAATLHFKAEEIFTIAVESAEIATLLQTLDARFNVRTADQSPVHNEEFKLYFIPEPEIKYSLFHNCNHEVVDWLRTLGCTIKGNGTFADFKVESVPAASTFPVEKSQ